MFTGKFTLPKNVAPSFAVTWISFSLGLDSASDNGKIASDWHSCKKYWAIFIYYENQCEMSGSASWWQPTEGLWLILPFLTQLWFAQWTACCCSVRSGPGPKSPTLLLFSSSKRRVKILAIRGWYRVWKLCKEMALPVVGALSSSVEKEVAHGGLLSCALTPFPQIHRSSLGSSSVSSALWLLLNFTEQQNTSDAAYP